MFTISRVSFSIIESPHRYEFHNIINRIDTWIVIYIISYTKSIQLPKDSYDSTYFNTSYKIYRW